MAETRPVPPLKVFISYSHRDEDLRERFLVHLSQLKRDGLIEEWHDRRITAGSEWAGAIDENLDSAHVIILLVSADFLASDYCNDIEMTRALERRSHGEARVVPVILKPCDWKTSRFAKLQALPKEGKPIVDWRTRDHGFVDAVTGLRRLIAEMCGPGRVAVQVPQTWVRSRPWRWRGGLALAAALLVGIWLWMTSNRHLKEGTDLLNIGIYAEARQPLERTRAFNPFSRMAGCGLAAIELDAMRSNGATFEQRLKEATQDYPNCAYLKVLAGDRMNILGKWDEALKEYDQAAKLEPGLAEAHFDKGWLLERQGKPDEALPEYQAAVGLSPGTPSYHDNLADLYFRRGERDKALEEYGQVSEFPLSALEIAKIYRLQGKLDLAAEREESAIQWLKQTPVKDAEAKYAWSFYVNPELLVLLTRFDEKACYAELELAATTFLKGSEDKARTAVVDSFERCGTRRQELMDILKPELHQVGSEVPDLTQRADKFVSLFLAPSNSNP